MLSQHAHPLASANSDIRFVREITQVAPCTNRFEYVPHVRRGRERMITGGCHCGIQVAERIGWMERAHELPAFERYPPRA
jgi:hypothetical protein